MELLMDSSINNNYKEFKNIFTFIDYCYRNKLTPENSVTYYENETMYIKRK